MKEINKILKDNDKLLTQIIRLIKKSNNIAVIGHINPDGDCIGSQLGLFIALKSIGKNIDVINEGIFKGNLKENYEKYFLNDIIKDYDLFIVVDVSNKERIGNFYNKMDFNKTIVIDHHITNHNFGKINWVSDIFISASEMIFLLLYKMKFKFNDANIAQNLINGVLSDNGFYQHIRVNKSLSLLITHLLIQRGADPNYSYEFMYCNNTIADIKFFALLLERISVVNNGRVFWTYITEQDKKNFGNIDFESSPLFSEMKSIKGFHIGIFFKVYESENKVDVSFRSIDKINVASVAGELGGGGHKVAAGVTVKGNFDDIKKIVFDKIEKLLDQVK